MRPPPCGELNICSRIPNNRYYAGDSVQLGSWETNYRIHNNLLLKYILSCKDDSIFISLLPTGSFFFPWLYRVNRVDQHITFSAHSGHCFVIIPRQVANQIT